jgi:acetyltransferase-like isoleucine patch superfamily enzyme
MRVFRSLHSAIVNRLERRNWPTVPRTCIIERGSRFPFKENIEIGDYVRIGHSCVLHGEGGISIGEGTIISDEVIILSYIHRYEGATMIPYDEVNILRPVAIGAYVWIGFRAMIAPGAAIGDGAIIGMGSVVTRDVEPGVVVGGSPARVLKKRDMTQFEQLRAEDRGYLKQKLLRGVIKIPQMDPRFLKAPPLRPE